MVSRETLAAKVEGAAAAILREAPFSTLKALETRLASFFSVRKAWGLSKRLRLVVPAFACREVARDAAAWGLVTKQKVCGELGVGSCKGLALENKRRCAAGLENATLNSLSQELGVTTVQLSTVLCEFEKLIRRFNTGLRAASVYRPSS